mgnify:CR=1 FL=1
MTYREAVAHGEKVLELSHIADAKTDAWLLLEMGCKIDRKFIICIWKMIFLMIC